MNRLKPAQAGQTKMEATIVVGLLTVILFFGASGFISYWNTRTLSRNAMLITHTHEVITALDDILSLIKDAETGQRGYLLTGEVKYLGPYNRAVPRIEERLAQAEQLLQDNPEQRGHMPLVRSRVQAKMSELQQTITLRRNRGLEAAMAVVASDMGLEEMDALRDQIRSMKEQERELRLQRFEEMGEAYRIAVISGVMASILGAFLSFVIAILLRRAAATRRRQEWLQSGQVGLGLAMGGEQRIEHLGDAILKFLAEYFDAQAGVFFARDGDRYRHVAAYGVLVDSLSMREFEAGDGLPGRAAKDGRPFLVHDVPEGYLTVGSALGRTPPRHLLICPVTTDGVVNAVMEIGFVHPVNEATIELLARVQEMIGVAIRSANYRSHLQNLLEETQRQAEEMQAQSEELRVANEELEEQGRALRESQARLEQQQAELEQTNAQLEEQTQILETQRDDLSLTKAEIQFKAHELERASQYKSDFLANMSHELRTPLNSSLILAKLLADNPHGNLTDEQVKFAQTIQSSGNDLLSLINDILDLSKIEAGHMEVRPEPVLLDRLCGDMARIFEPVAAQKGLTFKVSVASDCPETIDTDRQRIEQILKNLLSNAIKFTEKGVIDLRLGKGPQDTVQIAVADTGIGIAKEQQDIIFEAFRQADGTISRKYGGTGLGLSISRELARLLGGKIGLESEPEKGSVFTVTLPATYDPDLVGARPVAPPVSPAPAARLRREKEDAPSVPALWIEDDREKLAGDRRVILVVEDEESFARILYSMAHELNFQCLIAMTAEDALVLARQYLPNAVVLDVGLPDNSGLSVLDRLKRDPRTRHIPVHVVSASDYSQTAFSLGAVGYILKPVKREELVNALKSLETRFAHRMRRVLIVEDDDVQRDSMSKLLGSHDVETVGAETAAECLQLLQQSTFDCMVLDLSLPDASGYSLLETLSSEDAYSFPPVIVYTGHDLSADEEQRLRRYSKSIIIKGAKSPERLLDEVTLFLHQVVSELPAEQQRMLEKARNRDAILEGRKILIVEDDVANVYALTSILESRGALLQIARNGHQAIEVLEKSMARRETAIDLVLMDVMMPEMDGLTATREIRRRDAWKKLPVIMLTAKAMRDDQERCIEAGANDYMAKPLDVEKLLSLVRVWMPR